MYLRSLKLAGFKSFADRTRLEFERGVTVVVGPNGSGKSNIVDALAWVMGSQAPSTLRTQRMDDLVFAGTATRPQLGRAEVTLLLDNGERHLDLDLDEVSITRRLYRDGSSDYEINGAACRLLDIQELLSDSGVGRHQHVVVGQGQLTTILNAKPEDHRAVIEEAAGILKHRLRKERAIRRLERTDGDVQRLGDILRELQRQVRPLKRQADDAARHDAVRDELLALRRWLGGEELRTLDATIAELDARTAADETRLAEQMAELERAVGALEPLEAAAGDVGRELDRATAAAATLETQAERLRGLASVAAERRRSLAARFEGADERRADLETEHAELVAGRGPARTEETTALTAAENADAALRELDDELEALAEQERLPAEGALVVVRSELRGLETAAERDGRELRRLEGRLAELGDAPADTLDDLAGRVTAAEAEVDAARTHLTAADETVEIATAARERADAAARDAAAAHAAATSRRDALEAVVAGAADPRAVARASDLGPRIGTIAEVLDVPPELAHAVDTALGALSDALVFADGTDLAPIVDGLKREGLGGVPLVAAHGGPTVIARMVAATWGADALVDRLGPAANPGLAAVLLGDVVLVEGWHAGWEIVSRHPEVRVVTPDGDLITAAAVGVADPDGATPAMVDAARADAERRALVHHATAEAVREAEDALAEARRARTGAEAGLAAAERRLAEAVRALEADRRRSDAAADEYGRLDERRSALGQAITDRAERIESLRAQLGALEGEEAERQTAFEALAARRATVAQRREAVRAEAQRRRAEAGAASERREAVERRLAVVERELASLAQTRFDPEALDRLTVVADAAREALGVTRDHIAGLRERQVSLRDRSGEAVRRLADARRRVDDLRSSTEVLRARLADDKVTLAEARVRRESVAEGLRRDADADEAIALDQPRPELDPDVDPHQRVEALAADLRRMGPINPLAAQEYAELEERRSFMAEQLADLESSRAEIRKVISALEDEIERLFLAAFEEVAAAFTDHIEVLFPGGRGEVVLTEPDDLLGSGVDIAVQPLGKKVSRLSLLSGGEKSLAALAFLFAVFKARPSPFYVLDEVEAALDDANLRRFLRLVDAFRGTSQLLIVTHQQQTMEAADVLYGVTMEPGGSSKVVAKRLADQAELPAVS